VVLSGGAWPGDHDRDSTCLEDGESELTLLLAVKHHSPVDGNDDLDCEVRGKVSQHMLEQFLGL
jgi:hypothetical protein